MSAASGPAAPAKGREHVMTCFPSILLTQHSFSCCFLIRHWKAKHHSCFVSLHKAVWHDGESLVSGLSVDTISLFKGIPWEQDLSCTPGLFLLLNSYIPPSWPWSLPFFQALLSSVTESLGHSGSPEASSCIRGSFLMKGRAISHVRSKKC